MQSLLFEPWIDRPILNRCFLSTRPRHLRCQCLGSAAARSIDLAEPGHSVVGVMEVEPLPRHRCARRVATWLAWRFLVAREENDGGAAPGTASGPRNSPIAARDRDDSDRGKRKDHAGDADVETSERACPSNGSSSICATNPASKAASPLPRASPALRAPRRERRRQSSRADRDGSRSARPRCRLRRRGSGQWPRGTCLFINMKKNRYRL